MLDKPRLRTVQVPPGTGADHLNHANVTNATNYTNTVNLCLPRIYDSLTCDPSNPHFNSFDKNRSSPSQRQLTLHLNMNCRPRSNAEEKYFAADSREARKNGAGRRS
jgi:hypothetical protein